MRKAFFLIIIMLGYFSSQAQQHSNMKTDNNPLLCDPTDGICSIPQDVQPAQTLLTSQEKPVKLIYFTDPICSSCWGIEPQLRKLKLEYGDYLDIEYHMGGLLPDWSYNSGGISKPSDVAHHWDEVSIHYDMPIDGDVWLEDPMDSSYPPSIAFKAAQMQDEHKAQLFLRAIREMVFLEKKNITKWEHMADAAQKAGLDIDQFKIDYENEAIQHFNSDLQLARNTGVRGFPTLFIVNKTGDQEVIYGSRPYQVFESALMKVQQSAKKKAYAQSWSSLFTKYSSLTANEFALLSGMNRDKVETHLNGLVSEGHLNIFTTKNGSIWRLRQKN